MSVRITCVTKPGGNQNPHTAITRLGWLNESSNQRGISTREELWQWIKNGGEAYVKDALGNIVRVGADVNEHGTKYVRTYADGKWTDNLLALPPC
jgi:hypothetical protein